MKTGLQQTQGLRQELRMNPRLYQAMDLLYMPLMDLQQHLKQELLVNPFLELIEPEEELPEEKPPDKEEERAKAEAENEPDWENIILDGFQVSGGGRDLTEADTFERVRAQTTGLTEHLRDQLQMLDLTDRQRLLTEEFLGNVGDDGYLHATLSEIIEGANSLIASWADGPDGREHEPEDQGDEDGQAVGDTLVAAATVQEPHVEAAPEAEATPEVEAAPEPEPGPGFFTLEEAEALLHIMQQLDPPGICARDLRECLLIQMAEAGAQDTLTYQLVAEAFDDLIGHRWSDLAKRYNVEPRAVQEAADELAKLDPKPGLRFLPSDDEYVVPDLIVEKIDGEYRVFLNDTGTPRLRISRVYQNLVGDKKKFSGETKEFVNEKLNSATWLIQAIEQRRQTMLKVMNFIVDRQREFFEKGIEYLKPLTLREVAEVINMHESTVSRVTNQKYVQTPRGVFPLKFFFSSSLGTTTGEDASARAVRAQMQKLVGDENPTKPLTDAEIVDALKSRGIQIARRTVAKYRDQLGILPARMRKRL